mgnify:CR=1 FL=1
MKHMQAFAQMQAQSRGEKEVLDEYMNMFDALDGNGMISPDELIHGMEGMAVQMGYKLTKADKEILR